jgi:hypothetical protein
LTRSILTEIYIRHACSCPEILRVETPRQVEALRAQGVAAAQATDQLRQRLEAYERALPGYDLQAASLRSAAGQLAGVLTGVRAR